LEKQAKVTGKYRPEKQSGNARHLNRIGLRCTPLWVCVFVCSFNLQIVSPCCTYHCQIQIPAKVSVRYMLPHSSVGQTHTHMHTYIFTTRSHACNSIFNGGQRFKMREGKQAAHSSRTAVLY